MICCLQCDDISQGRASTAANYVDVVHRILQKYLTSQDGVKLETVKCVYKLQQFKNGLYARECEWFEIIVYLSWEGVVWLIQDDN